MALKPGTETDGEEGLVGEGGGEGEAVGCPLREKIRGGLGSVTRSEGRKGKEEKQVMERGRTRAVMLTRLEGEPRDWLEA